MAHFQHNLWNPETWGSTQAELLGPISESQSEHDSLSIFTYKECGVVEVQNIQHKQGIKTKVQRF